MGFYVDNVLPRGIDKLLGTGEIMKYRGQIADGLHGEVVEIGFGSGLNCEKYPPEVTRVYAIDPATVGRTLAADRVAATHVEVRYVGLDGEKLPLDDESCDSALCTYTLCTIPDARQAVAEVRRVLKPGGRFHVLEHGISTDEGVARWQHRLNSTQKVLFGGCNLDRDPVAYLDEAGFEVERSDSYYAKGPKPWSYFYEVVARKPD